jgi:hypothetical protein
MIVDRFCFSKPNNKTKQEENKTKQKDGNNYHMEEKLNVSFTNTTLTS